MSDTASEINDGQPGNSSSTHDEKSFPNTTIPKVDNEDRANDTETEVVGSKAIIAMMQMLNALRDDGRRRRVQALSPATVMIAARMAEAGIAVNTRYATMNSIWNAHESHRGDFIIRRTHATNAATSDRWAPLTATI